jgi:MFS family permease
VGSAHSATPCAIEAELSLTDGDLAVVQRRTLGVLVSGQILGGLGFGATLSMGSLLFEELSGTAALSGMAATMSTLGAALAAIPLARIAHARGRRPALMTGASIAAVGAVITVLAPMLNVLPLLFLGIALIGMGNAANLQARFAATDLATPARRGRDLSIVVWSTTIGAVVGPNLLDPGEALGAVLGLPHLTGPFLLTVSSQILAVVVYFFALRPDPLVTAMRTVAERPAVEAIAQTLTSRGRYRFAVLAIALSHATMVAIMAMTPVHLKDGGATLQLVGFTISLHVAGMYALSPVFGFLTDRIGKVQTILLGQGLLAAGLVVNFFAADSAPAVAVALTLIGLGWSSAVIAGSALVTESTPVELRTRNQGRNDVLMSLAGAIGGALAGPGLAVLGYSGLALAVGALVAVVVVASVTTRAASPAP